MSAFIDQRRQDFGVELICRTIGTSASAYYQRASGERSARDIEDDRLLGVIGRVHAENYEAYGSRRMWKALRREGESTGRGRVERLMSRNAIVGAKRRGKPWRTTIAGAEPVSTPDLLERDFTASRPNERWCADFTYLRCWTGVLFLSFVIDVYSRMIVGWRLAGHMRESLVEDALQMAVATRRIDSQYVESPSLKSREETYKPGLRRTRDAPSRAAVCFVRHACGHVDRACHLGTRGSHEGQA